MATSMITLPGFISLRSSRSIEPRGLGAGDQDRADHQVGPLKLLADRCARSLNKTVTLAGMMSSR